MFLVLKWPIRAREWFNSAMNLIHSSDLKRLLTTGDYFTSLLSDTTDICQRFLSKLSAPLHATMFYEPCITKTYFVVFFLGVQWILFRDSTFSYPEWYKEMKMMHSKAQDDCYKEEEEREHLENKDIKVQLKKELNILDDISAKGAPELLEYIYHRYPPKDEKLKLAPGFRKHLKKALRNASIHYHPDKIDESMHGKRWKVMSGEIVKRVNQHYDRIKM